MSMSIEQQEIHRLTIQTELDAKKSREERNRLGQFATPTTLAQEMIAYGMQLLPKRAPVRFLDPAFGTGSFYSALLAMAPPARIDSAHGIEIDRHYGVPSKTLWKKHSLRLDLSDFTRMQPPR